MSFIDISEEINYYFYSIPTEVLEKTSGIRKYQQKTKVPNIYTRYSTGDSTSVLQITGRINLSDQGTLTADNYYNYDWEENYYEERGDEYDIIQEYWNERGEKQNVTTYVHYQDHVYWATATFYENLVYAVPGATYHLERACKKQKREAKINQERVRPSTVQEIFIEEDFEELLWQYPEQGTNQPVGTYIESVRIPVRNTHYVVRSSNVRVELSRTSKVVPGWLPRVEWDHYRFYPSTTNSNGLRSILKKRKIPLGSTFHTVTEPLPPNSHIRYIDERERLYEWFKYFWVPHFSTREEVDQVRPINIDYTDATYPHTTYFPDRRPTRSTREIEN
jgi:hypothetical protein